jgi:transcriptional regulator with XRE-family HTH domain
VTVYSSASAYSDADIPRQDACWQIMPMRYALDFKDLRKRANLTQGALAAKVGVEQPTIARWEKGAQKPALDDLSELAEALGVHPGELFRDAELADQSVSTEDALRQIVAAVLRSGGSRASESAVRPLVDGLSRGLQLLIRNPAIRSNPDALEMVVHAISSRAPEAMPPS